MRVLYAGSPGIAAPVLEVLAAEQNGWELAGVLTSPDAPKGRRGRAGPSELGWAAEALSQKRAAAGASPIPIIKPEKLDAQARSLAAALNADLLVSFAYGRYFGPQFLALFPLGGINIHPSLLPRYRGPAPIQAAILRRDAETGVTIQRLAFDLDSGDILAQERFPLSGEETAETLGARAARVSAGLLPKALQAIKDGRAAGRPQNHGEASFCGRIRKDEGRVDWERSAWDIDARIRAFTPWPLCRTFQGRAELVILAGKPYGADAPPGAEPGRVLGADKERGVLIQTGEGLYGALRLQYETKKALDWRSFLNGAPDFIGSRLTGTPLAIAEGNH